MPDFRTLTTLSCLFLVGILLAACGTSGSSPAVPTAAPRLFEPAECRVAMPPGQNTTCGYLTVPQNRSQPDGQSIRLYVTILHSKSETPRPDPLVYLEGGPGGRAHEMAYGLSHALADVLAERDIILPDQRGTGWSEPALDCPEYNQGRLQAIAAGEDLAGIESAALQGWQACRERLLAEGVDLSQYTSAESAADIAELAGALGYPQVNLLGLSYGTRLGLTILRDYPQVVRSAVLDSIIPPNVDFFETASLHGAEALDLVFERCAADEKCNTKFPNLKARYQALVTQLDKEPLTLSAAGIEYPVHGHDLSMALFYTLYDTETIKKLPGMITGVEQGKTEWIAGWLNGIFGMGIDWGAHLSAWCSEEAPYNSSQETAKIEARLDPAIMAGMNLDGDYFKYCQVWDTEPAGKIESQAVASAVPALLLVGDYDPVTPPEFARLTAESLENARLYEFTGITHGVIFSTYCAKMLFLQFLEDPQADIDASCLDQLQVTFMQY